MLAGHCRIIVDRRRETSDKFCLFVRIRAEARILDLVRGEEKVSGTLSRMLAFGIVESLIVWL